jgi:acyl-homoserine-lactone acylase
MPLRPLSIVSLCFVLAACSDATDSVAPTPPPPAPELTYSAEIRRTEYGIPHIRANDWGSLGYGFGYAYAQDNYCVAMREIVFAAGRSAELMGEEMGNTESDFLFRFLNGGKEAFAEQFVSELPQFARDLAEGYSRGMNRYLEETGLDNLPEGDLGCRNAEWVYAIDSVDLFLFLRREALRGSSEQGIFRRAILATTGPDGGGALEPAAMEQAVEALEDVAAELRDIDRGSNGLALGATQRAAARACCWATLISPGLAVALGIRRT